MKFRRYWIFWLLLSLLIASLAITGFILWKNFNKPMVIQKEYTGIRWNDADGENEDPTPFTLLIDGVSTKDEPFRGTVIIKSGDEELYRFEDCKLIYEITQYFLCDADFPENYTIENQPAKEHYAVMYFSENWSEVVLVNVKEEAGLWDSTSRVVFAAPATNLDEAIAVAKRTPAGTKYSSFD